MRVSTTIEERFWSKVVKTEKCWNWTGATQRGGYGVISAGFWKGKIIAAHRFSYFMHYKKDPRGKVVCHKCDNPKCVRPNHLFLGTHADNVRDKIKKGRAAWNTKLTPFQVKYIRTLYKNKTHYIKDLAKRFNVNRGTISKIVNNHSWNHH